MSRGAVQNTAQNLLSALQSKQRMTWVPPIAGHMPPTVNHYPLGVLSLRGARCTTQEPGAENVFDKRSCSPEKTWRNIKFSTLIELDGRYKMMCVVLRRGARYTRYARENTLYPSTKLHLSSGLQGKRLAQPGRNLQTLCKRH